MGTLSTVLRSVTVIVENMEERGIPAPDVVIDSDSLVVQLDWFVGTLDDPADGCATIAMWAATLGEDSVKSWHVGPNAAIASLGPGILLRIFYGGELSLVDERLRLTVEAMA